MANLLFKKGLYGDFKDKVLTGNAAVEGTLYLTEDEGGLYLGKSDGSVVRIQGTLHQYANLTDFAADVTPPYSTDVVYFIADKDALVRYNGTKWIQLNTPASVAEKLASDIATNVTAIEGLQTAVADNTANIGKNTTAITNLRTDAEASISGLNTRLTKAEADILEKATIVDLKALETIVEGQGSAIADINTALAEKASQTDLNALDGRVTTAEGEIDTLQSDLNAAEELIATKASQEALNALSNTVEGQGSAIGGLDTRLTTAEGEIDTLQSDLARVEENVATKASQEALNALSNTVKDKVDQSEYNGLANTVSGHTTAIENLTSNKVDKNGTDRLMTVAEGNKLAGIEEGATKTIIDEALSTTSVNPVQNKVITTQLNSIGNTLQGLDNSITDIVENYATTESVTNAAKDLQDQIDEINETIGGANGSSVSERLTALETFKTEADTSIKDHENRIGALEDGLSTTNKTVAGIDERLIAAEGEIDALQEKDKALDEEISGIKGRLDTAEGEIDTLQSQSVNYENRIAAIETALPDLATDAELEAAETRLNTTINNRILAANAMTYEGPIASKAELEALTDVNVGDTYVVTEAFDNYKPGDLLIAQGDEDEDGIILSVTWDHVPTGYSEVFDPELVLEDNTIVLKDYAGSNLGGVVINSVSDNVKITSQDSTINISLEWGEF